MVRKNMTNTEIYNIAMQLNENIAQLNLHLPVKINFYLKKNMDAIIKIAEDIERSRNEILEKYGTINSETNSYDFSDENLPKANAELMDLFMLEQEVPIYEISLEAFEDIELDAKQVNAIMYMIKEDEEEEE